MAKQKSQRELVVHIKGNTKHFQINMEKSEESLKKFRRETRATYGATDKLSSGFQKAASQASILHGPLNGISGRLNAIATALRISSIAWVAAGAAISSFSVALVNGVRVASESERQIARLNAILKATEGAAGFSANALDRMAREVAEATLASTEGVRDAIGVLATFRSVSGDTFKESIDLSQSMAEVMGTNITSAALMMGKALENPLTGLTSLGRAGVTFNDIQKDMIEEAMQVGDIFAAQAVILEGVKSQLDGIGEAVAKQTQAGVLDTFGQKWNEIGEALAKAGKSSWWIRKFFNEVNTLLHDAARRLDVSLFSDVDLEKEIKEQTDLVARLNVEYAKKSNQLNEDRVLHANTRLQELLSERNKRAREAYQADLDAQVQADEKARQEREAAYNRALEDYVKFEEKVKREQEKQRRAAAGRDEFAIGTEKIEEEYATLLERLERWEEKELHLVRGHNQLIADVEAEFFELRLLAQQAFLEKWDEAMLAAEDRQSAYMDKMFPMDDDQEDWENFKKRMDKKMTVWKSYADSVGDAFGIVAQHMKEGSREQRVFLALEKSAALATALMNTFAAAAGAMNMPTGATPIQRMAAYAAVLSTGMASVAAISNVALSARASGGPVVPGGSYWVGERGPEIITTGASGHVTPTDKLTPNVNVNIVEDASRAGTVDQEGSKINVYVAAAINQLTDDFNNGRGLFGAMENKYGLTRR